MKCLLNFVVSVLYLNSKSWEIIDISFGVFICIYFLCLVAAIHSLILLNYDLITTRLLFVSLYIENV